MKNTRTVRQFLFQTFVLPLFPLGQWLVLRLGIVKGPKTYSAKDKRQHFHIGYLKKEHTSGSFREHLLTQGFFDHTVALPDPGQVFSMRRLDDVQPTMQYHIRLFEDGEVKGHHEYTPEDNFVGHMEETILEPRTVQFLSWCGDYVTLGEEKYQ